MQHMTTRTVAALALAALLLPAAAAAQVDRPAKTRTQATTTAPKPRSAQGDLTAKAKERAYAEIDRRIDALTKQTDRIGGMKRVATSTKTALGTTAQAQIAALEDLKARIAADSSTTTLKANIQSIGKSYRIFALVMPQSAIAAAVDRINTLADLMTTMSGKLAARIADSSASDSDKAAAHAALNDFNSKVASAKTKAQSALSSVTTLKPDNGDASTQAGNKAALEAARASIKEAQNLLIEARKNISTIVSTVKGKGASATTTAN